MYIKLKKFSDGGKVYLAPKDKGFDKDKFADFRLAIPFEEGQIVNFIWPDGQMDSGKIILIKETHSMGSKWEPVHSFIPSIEVFHNGYKFQISLDKFSAVEIPQTIQELFNEIRFIGFWANDKDPKKCSYAQEGNVLPWPEDFVDESWNEEEKNIIIKYIDAAPNVEFWRGFSKCRLCGEVLGSTDQSDNSFVWPSGYSHYLRVHGVKPSQEFIQHVLNKVSLEKQNE